MPTLRQYRADLDELVRLANGDLGAIWKGVSDGVSARKLLQAALPELGDLYGSAAGSLAADWYDDLRVEQDIVGRFRARVAVPDISRTDKSAVFSVDPIFKDSDFAAALVNAAGELQKIIADTGRGTITGSAIADPGAQGWMRASSGGCKFCQQLAGRGAVYSKSTVRFGSHPNCRCEAVPVFGGQPLPVLPFYPSSDPPDSVRRWMADNGY